MRNAEQESKVRNGHWNEQWNWIEQPRHRNFVVHNQSLLSIECTTLNDLRNNALQQPGYSSAPDGTLSLVTDPAGSVFAEAPVSLEDLCRS